MTGTINRRSFIKMMGWGGVGTALGGCDVPTTVTLEEGKEDVVSYLMPEEYVIPGVGVWYASTCAQCAAACGTQGRVREGRVLKMEGNPNSSVNRGKLCMMGQAGLQGHYNPDRIKEPMIRKNGSLTMVGWDQALATINDKLNATEGARVAWITGTVSGHQKVLLNALLESVGSGKHYAHEVVSNKVLQAVNRDMLGDAMPRLRFDKAKMILSFGADFLGSWMASPVHFAGEYAKFRSNKPRGLLVAVEPKMSLTGGNADLWIASRPGSEAAIALAIANELVNAHNKDAAALPESVRNVINQHSVERVAKQTGVDAERIKRVAQLLNERSPSLVLAGAPVEGQTDGYAATAAIMLLNQLLGNIGETIESPGAFAFAQLEAKTGGTADLLAFAQDAQDKKLDVAFFYGANPVYSAPAALGLDDALKNIGLKVAISQFMDETTAAADVILPAASYLEDWGTHVPAYHPAQPAISMQQPLMERLYETTRGFGDVLLALLQNKNKDQYGQYADYYAYLRHAFSAMPASYKENPASEEHSWNAVLQKGIINVQTTDEPLNASVADIEAPKAPVSDPQYPFVLVPSVRLGLWDGRHANLPWLQEAPDQIAKVVWDSWAEIHPSTAKKLGIEQGSIIKVSSKHGELTLKAVLLKGVHPDVVAIPMGQGHIEYGRYAKGLGVNPLKILAPAQEQKTGELAMYATNVKIANTGEKDEIVKIGSTDTQMGRKLVGTVPVEQVRRTEGA
jgi:molybdopterin-containing oxidoreductase family iron-sulfur binding subunit